MTFSGADDQGARLTQIFVDLLDANDASERLVTPVDLPLAIGGSVTAPLPDLVTVPAGREPVRIRIGATGVDRDGLGLTTRITESLLTLVDATGSGTAAAEVTVLAAGDIADCDSTGARDTARILEATPGEILSLGDHVYPSGSSKGFATCYDATWGKFRGRTHPTPGNHDWGEEAGTPYFEYFGAAAGPRSGFYSFDLGAWHVLSLNSNVGGGVNSPQFHWAQADVLARRSKCTMAIWHHAPFSSGPIGNSRDMQQIWWMLDHNGVDVVLAAHEHMYERFAPQNHEGVPSPEGIRLFVVGTGGARLAGPQRVALNSELRGASWGVLRMTLRSDGYAWTFLGVPGATFNDSGSADCQ